MSDLPQSGNYSVRPQSGGDNSGQRHPDADQLNAFVEHTLPERERLKTLAHLADCANCRKIVALSVVPLEDAAEVEPQTVVLPRLAGSLAAFFSGWNAAWIAGLVFAGLVILTLYLSHSPAKGPRTGQVAESRRSVRLAPPPSTVGSKPPESSPTRQTALRGKFAHGAKTTHSPKAHSIDDLALNSRETAIPVRPTLPAARGSILQPKAAPAKGSQSMGGPAVFQSRAAGKAPHAGAATTSRSTQSANALDLSQTPVQTTSPLSQSAALTVDPIASPVAQFQPRLPLVLNQASIVKTAPTASADLSAITVNAQETQRNEAGINGDAPEGLTSGDEPANAGRVSSSAAARKAAYMPVQVPLPSGLAVSSLAASLHRRLALDARNQLFFSEDDGQHWKAVSTAWRGRAITVATLPVAPVPASSLALSVPERYTRGAIASAQPEADLPTSLNGTITDISGAAVPGATVVVTDSHTAFVRSVQTDFAGHYLVEELPPGVYQVEVQTAGFQKQSQIAVVSSAQQAVKNLMLSVSQSSQSVTAETSSAQLQTSSRNMPIASVKLRKVTPAPPINGVAPAFVITTETNDRWTSPDGLTWKRE